MLIGYYLICPRKAWLSVQGLWMEQESEAVALGRLLDQSSYSRNDKHITLHAELPSEGERPAVALVGKIDHANLKEGVLHETKKGRACEEAHVWQLRFYLWLLHRNGVQRANGNPFTGQLDYPALRRTEAVTLTTEDALFLEKIARAVAQLYQQPTPPPRITQRNFCRKCAFEELCYG